MERREFLKRAGVGSVVLASFPAFAGVARADDRGGGDESTIRWDITTVAGTPPTITAAGSASALATPAVPLKITLTGSGTFKPDEDDEVTGGGTWKTFDQAGAQTGTGTYKVRGLVAWHEAPGTLPSPPVVDTIGRPADARAGLAVLQIRYDAGGLGKLVVSCHLPVGSPDSIFEGITASKGFVDYFRPEANTTIFHVLRDDNDDGDE